MLSPITLADALNKNAQYEEAYHVVSTVLESLDLTQRKGVLSPQEAQALRVSILDTLHHASGGLGRHEEMERLLRLLFEVRTDDFHTPDTIFGIQHSISSSLKNQGRLEEALTMNTGLLSSLETEQGRYGVSERTNLYALTNRAFILQCLRTRRQQDGSAQS